MKTFNNTKRLMFQTTSNKGLEIKLPSIPEWHLTVDLRKRIWQTYLRKHIWENVFSCKTVLRAKFYKLQPTLTLSFGPTNVECFLVRKWLIFTLLLSHNERFYVSFIVFVLLHLMINFKELWLFRTAGKTDNYSVILFCFN